MTNEQGYNGWSNYETWCVNLWITNDRGLSEMFEESGRHYFEEFENVHDATIRLSEQINEHVAEIRPDLEPSMFSDLLQSALDNVDFYEIAKHFIEQAKESLETQY